MKFKEDVLHAIALIPICILTWVFAIIETVVRVPAFIIRINTNKWPKNYFITRRLFHWGDFLCSQ